MIGVAAGFDREQIRGWIEEASGVGLSVADALPDSLAVTAEALGLHPEELRLWVGGVLREGSCWTPAALAEWAARPEGFR